MANSWATTCFCVGRGLYIYIYLMRLVNLVGGSTSRLQGANARVGTHHPLYIWVISVIISEWLGLSLTTREKQRLSTLIILVTWNTWSLDEYLATLTDLQASCGVVVTWCVGSRRSLPWFRNYVVDGAKVTKRVMWQWWP